MAYSLYLRVIGDQQSEVENPGGRVIEKRLCGFLMKPFREPVILLSLMLVPGVQFSFRGAGPREEELGPDLKVREIAERVWLHTSQEDVPVGMDWLREVKRHVSG